MSRPFTAEDLRRWEAHAVPAWVYKGVLLVGWGVAFGYAVTTTSGCTPAAPCYPDPWLSVFAAALLATPVLLWREPVLGCALGAGFGLVEVVFEAHEGIRLAFGLHGLACVAVALWLVEARRAQHRVFGGISRPVLVPHPTPVRFTGRSVVAVLMLLVGVLALGKYAVDSTDAAEHTAAAVRVSGTVVTVGEYDVTLELPSSRRTFDVLVPASYAVGMDVPVLVDGQWAELVAEPEDVTFPLTVMALTLGMAAFLRLRDVAGRRAWQRVFATPSPSVEVLVRADPRGRAVLHTVDGKPFGSMPVSRPFEDDRMLAVGDLSYGGWVVLVGADTVLLPNRPLRPYHRTVPRFDDPGEELLGVALEIPPLPFPVQPHHRDVVASRWLFAAAVFLTAGAATLDGPIVLTALWTAGTCAVAGWVRGRPSAVFHQDHATVRSWLRTYHVPWSAVTSIRRDGDRLVLELDSGARFTLAQSRRPVTELGAIARRLHDTSPHGGELTSRFGGALPVALFFTLAAGAVLLLT
ncbi:PH domain-containing protein [Actinosynnema sp. CS-041913]|uniref:PH domain-containing protein n=1 Tax=Actinosynnema sp. CS-041913 TaxID=3239917 RepID=UPI003D90DB65